MKHYTVLWWDSWPSVAMKLGIPVLVDPRTLGLWPRFAYWVWRIVTDMHSRTQYFFMADLYDLRLYKLLRVLLLGHGLDARLYELGWTFKCIRRPVRWWLRRRNFWPSV